MNIEHCCAHFIIQIGEKSSLVDDFQQDLMMIVDSGLLFSDHPVYILYSIRLYVVQRRLIQHWIDCMQFFSISSHVSGTQYSGLSYDFWTSSSRIENNWYNITCYNNDTRTT